LLTGAGNPQQQLAIFLLFLYRCFANPRLGKARREKKNRCDCNRRKFHLVVCLVGYFLDIF